MIKVLPFLVKPLIRREVLGWGYLYKRFVGNHGRNKYWSDALPRVIRDKRYGHLHLLDIREWADRSFYFIGRWYDLKTQLLLEKMLRKGDTVLDVGGNYGHFSLASASLVGDSGRVLTFEPNPKAYARLRLHIELNDLKNVNAQNAGLADKAGKLELSVPKINCGEASFAGSDYTEGHIVECPVLVGDEEVGDAKVDFVKIDVEGFEIRVLSGLMQTIEREKPWILTEVVSRHLARDNRVPGDLDSILRPKGYEPFRLGLTGPRGRQKQVTLFSFDGPVGEGDVLWVPENKKNLIGELVEPS